MGWFGHKNKEPTQDLRIENIQWADELKDKDYYSKHAQSGYRINIIFNQADPYGYPPAEGEKQDHALLNIAGMPGPYRIIIEDKPAGTCLRITNASGDERDVMLHEKVWGPRFDERVLVLAKYYAYMGMPSKSNEMWDLSVERREKLNVAAAQLQQTFAGQDMELGFQAARNILGMIGDHKFEIENSKGQGVYNERILEKGCGPDISWYR